MKLVDSHCHIHESEFFDEAERELVYERAIKEDVGMICVATSEAASIEAIDFASQHNNTWAVIGVHPHDTKNGYDKIDELLKQHSEAISGVGEIGLDYFYMNSPREVQIEALEQQLQWAIDHNKPVSFHVRDDKTGSGAVWNDFWPIFDNFKGVKGVLHSFTDTQTNLDKGFERGLYVGVNGISTFTRDEKQQRLYADIPLDRLLLETDAPFLTPAPFRGKMNEPRYVGRVAEHMAALRDLAPALISEHTTENTRRLFDI